jgi:hypothetical protein
MNAMGRLTEQHVRLPHVLWRAPALLLLNRYARGVDVPLELGAPLELLSRPELHRSQTQWQTVGCSHQTRMHETPYCGNTLDLLNQSRVMLVSV